MQCCTDFQYLTERNIVSAKITNNIARLAREGLWAEPGEPRAGGQPCGGADCEGGQDDGEDEVVRHDQVVGKLAQAVTT